jgi:hypothetical protein
VTAVELLSEKKIQSGKAFFLSIFVEKKATQLNKFLGFKL